MKNLLLRSDQSTQLECSERGEVRLLSCNTETEAVFYVQGPASVCCSSPSTWQVDLAQQVPDLDNRDAWISSISFALDLDALCITTSGGHLLLLDPESKTVDEVGLIEGGIVTASWSPGGELLAVITSSALLLLFNKAFEVLAETELLAAPDRVVPSRQLPPQEPSDAQIPAGGATISWRGDGKYVATLSRAAPGGPMVLRVWERDACVLHAIGEHSPDLLGPLAWQPNGRHIYAAQRLDGQQRVVLFERNGLSHGHFEVHHEGQVSGLAWSSDSELLAVHLSAETGQAVQLWRRSNWHWYLKQELRFTDSCGLQMQWSDEGPNTLTTCTADGILRKVQLGTGLAVSALGTAAVIDGCEVLLTPLRRCVVPPPLCAVTARFKAPVQLLALLDGAPSEVVAAALADGSIAVLRSCEADMWEETLDAATVAGQHAHDANGCAHQDAEALMATAVRFADSETLPAGQHIRCLAWESDAKLLAVAGPVPGGGPQVGSVLLEFELTGHLAISPETQVTATCSGRIEVDGEVLLLESVPGASTILQLSTGRVLRYADGHLSEVESFPQPCPWMIATPPASLADGLPPAVGLTVTGAVYLGQTLVASSATSIAVRRATWPSPDYLLYTTKDNFLHTRPFAQLLAQPPEPSPAAPANRHREQRHRGMGETSKRHNHYADMHAAMRGHATAVPSGNILKARAVEQGSVIVAAPPDGIAVVLQLPRGNLETVYPRSLVLPAIASAVQASEFERAWQVATAHRVDLNLLVDYGWPRFLQTAADFVRQVPDDQDLMDLLSALRDDSVIAEGGLYAGLPPADMPGPEASGVMEGGKVDLVSAALRDAMTAVDAELYLKPILISHASQGQLEVALALLKDAKEAQMAREASHSQASTSSDVAGQQEGVRMGQGDLGQHRRGQARSAPTAEDALSRLLLTVDAEQLYRAALGMYELELAYMVVAHSQRDPGEYLLELQQFAAQPEGPLRQHAINMHLGRTSAALRDLLAAGDGHFDRAVQLARSEGKLRELLSMVSDAARRKQVLDQYGEWLAQRNMHEDAAVAFLAASNLPAALAEYQQGNHWQMALAVAGRLGYAEEEMRGLAEGFVESLTASSRLVEAAAIAAQHLADGDSAVALLAQAREWREALRTAALFDRQDLVETTVAPAAAEAASALLEELEDTQARIAKYDARLREVRERKAAMAAALDPDEEGPADPGDFDDAASEGGSSVVSGLSAYTQASAGAASTAASTGRSPSTVGGRWPQRQRKKSKKGPKIRQGSPEEEAALVSHIASLAQSAKQCTEAGQLAELLVLLGHEADARRIQSLLSAVIAQQQAAAERAQQAPAAATASLNNGIKSAALPAKPAAVDWKFDILRPL